MPIAGAQSSAGTHAGPSGTWAAVSGLPSGHNVMFVPSSAGAGLVGEQAVANASPELAQSGAVWVVAERWYSYVQMVGSDMSWLS